ncbi:sporulation protein YqfD [Paenibacillus segetis]|uniref:Sporulation protein YqfD n=1 Tax=Paenibacillus segetis TaxID=1325360 RepID=A0ABQ1YHQ3_9BACL|nr:sporulation protein YqfD [Paenibacillus segetis]GGH26711.1 sporulation protein YqfD [Paenibacillus segetis]
MKSPVLSRLRGFVTIVVRSKQEKQIEIFINELAKRNIEVWDLRPLTNGNMELNIQLADFFSLRPLLKGTGCRLHVKRRYGMPFMLERLWRRKWFILGFAMFIAVIFSLTSLVWSVQVKGNEKIVTEDVLNAARQEGIYPFQWIFRLKAQDKLSAELTRKLPGTSWVGVSRTGTVITIQIVEANVPKEQELHNPQDLVSKADAVVTHIYAEKGLPQVRKNDRVKKGQVLISGLQGGQAVVSKGEVKGIVWHEYNIEVPLVHKQKVYTGESKQRGFLYFGKTAVQLSGYGKLGYEQSQTLVELDPLSWRDIKLPIGWMTEKVYETTEIELKRSQENAKKEGIVRAQRDIVAKYGVNSAILEQKILHEKTDNGKVYMKVLFEVEQDIAEELPIVQDQGE